MPISVPRPVAARVLLVGLLAVTSGLRADDGPPPDPIPILTAPAERGPETAAPLTLARALQQALDFHPDLAVARREVEAEEGAALQAHARPNPSIEYLLEDRNKATRSTTLQLAQTIELGGKREARIAATRFALVQARLDLAVRRAEIQAQVRAAFTDTLVAQERVRLAADSVELARRAADVVTRRVQAGKLSPVEETRARVAVASAVVEATQARSELDLARSRLGSLWGRPVPVFTRAEGDLAVPPEEEVPAVLEARLTASPHLRRAALEVDRRGALSALERARRIPDPTVSVGVKRVEELGRDQLLVGVAVPIPVFDRNQGNLLEALRREDKARDERTALGVRLAAELRQVRARFAAAREEAQLLRDTVLPAAAQAYEKAGMGFELGKFAFLDVLDAQRTLFQARARYLAALAEAHRHAAEIDRLLSDRPANESESQEREPQ